MDIFPTYMKSISKIKELSFCRLKEVCEESEYMYFAL